MAEAPKVEEPSIIEVLRGLLVRADTYLRNPEIPLEALFVLGSAPSRLEKIYGKNSPLLSGFPFRGG
jgi:hypothetical protein